MENNLDIELHVPDFKPVKDFYSKLGFSLVWERQPEGQKGYLVLKRGQTILCFWCGNEQVLDQEYFKNFPADTSRGYGVEIVIPISDVESFYEQVKVFANVVGQLQVRPWGMKDFRIIDPFGFYLRFTEPHDILDSRYTEP